MMFSCFKSYRGWAALSLAIILGGYLVIWHGAHLAAVLPFLVLAACPLMHIFMHGGHGRHHRPETSEGRPPTSPPADSQKPKKDGE
jgi:Protein of unknown function (DUF2933)